MTTKTKATLDDLMARLATMNDELYRMSPSKLGSAWHADRATEVRMLAKRIEMLMQAAE